MQGARSLASQSDCSISDHIRFNPLNYSPHYGVEILSRESRCYRPSCTVTGLEGSQAATAKCYNAFISGRDVFVALPTGYGKSLIYACLPRVFDLLLNKEGSIVLVVCPLIALTEDQVTSFRKLGLSAAFVGEKSVRNEELLNGQKQLVLISPESLR